MNKSLLRLLDSKFGDAALRQLGVLLYRFDQKSPGILRVLTYHRVDEPGRRPWLYPGLISATPDAFQRQMAFLAEHYYLVSPDELIQAVIEPTKNQLPPQSVLVTFDDAYVDFFENAWPIMKSFNIPVILFVPTAYPDHPEKTFWWDQLHHALAFAPPEMVLDLPHGSFGFKMPADRLRAYKAIRDHFKSLRHEVGTQYLRLIFDQIKFPVRENAIMGWADLERAAKEGVTLGAHTQTHPLLNRVSIQEVDAEISGSVSDLARKIGVRPRFFAYPSGGVDEQVVELTARAGFSAAFTTEVGINHSTAVERYRLKRINVGSLTSLSALPVRLSSGLYRFS